MIQFLSWGPCPSWVSDASSVKWGCKMGIVAPCSMEENLDSILKSRDITLQTEVHLVNAMVFPVVMYGCESWTVKKAEC